MSKTDTEKPLLESEYKVYKYRYIISFFYFVSSAFNGIMFICYSPVLTSISKIYGVSLSYVTFGINLIWLVIYPPVNFLSNYILDTYGLRAGILFGNFMTLSGLWIRTFCRDRDQFSFLFIGQFLGAIGQPFIIGAPQKVSAVWYPPSERTMSTAILSTANSVGLGVGIYLTQMFVSDHPKIDDGLNEIYNLSLFHAILASVVLVPGFFLFKNKPPTPPSKGANAEKFSYKESLKSLWKNSNYKIFILGSAMMYGTFNVLSIVLQPVINPFGFTSSDASNLGGITLLFGLVGSILVGIYVNKTKKLKKTIVICCLVSLASLGMIVGLAFTGNVYLVAIGFAVFGFFTVATFPLIFELCVEISFPVNEASASGIFIAFTAILAVGVSEGITNILDIDNEATEAGIIYSSIGMLVLFACEIIGVIAMVLTKEDLKRTMFESLESEEEKIGSMVEEITNEEIKQMAI